ncbi:MAG TPA: ComF family protein [Thermoanaerobaculia bacterium]
MRALVDAASFLGRETLRIVLPASCAACGGELPWRARSASCCRPCWSALRPLEGVRCRRCAAAWEGGPAGASFLCLRCASIDDDAIERIDAWGAYRDGLERLLVAFKFRRHDFLDAPLAGLLAERWRAWSDGDFDAVVPVPMHPRKLRERGYNQAALLARRFARATKLTLYRDALRKTRETAAQSTLRREERASNVRGAFTAADGLRGRRILLIDDVCTTGATLRACAKALRRAGAARVAALTVARA